MYALKPLRVYVSRAVLSDPDSLARSERILRAAGKCMEDATVYERDQVYDLAREMDAWPWDELSDAALPQRQRSLVLTPIDLDRAADEDPLVAGCPEGTNAAAVRALLGHIDTVTTRHTPEMDDGRNMVCWTTHDLGIMNGCPHGCLYCGQGKSGKFLAAGTNIHQILQRVVVPLVEAHPEQKCFRLIGNGADIITFEPEYGAFADLLETLSAYEDRYAYFHTNSDNVDWIENVPHRDRLIGIWSLASEASGQLIEPAAPSAADRIEAVRKCQAWGVPTRVKFKPIVPIRGWRQAYAETIERLLNRAEPETIGFCVIMWMDLDALAAKIDLDILDPAFVKAAEASRSDMQDRRCGPFPHHVRKEVYQHLIAEVRKWNRQVPLYISTETREMWEDIKGDLGQNPQSFMCGCNPIEIPGPKMRPTEALCKSTYYATQ